MKMNEDKVSVVIVDDHALIHKAVTDMLANREDMVVVGEGWCGEHVFQLVEEHHPDVLILDLRMPQYRGGFREERFNVVPSLAKLNKEYPDTAVIILSQHVNYTFAQAAVEHGVRSYLLKGDQLSLNIPEAIDAVLAGRTLFSREINDFLFGNMPDGINGHQLNGRQLEIVQALVRSPEKSNQQLAEELHIAESTLKGHLNKIFSVLDVPNRSTLVIRSLQARLVPFHVDDRGGIVLE
jgi:DNA-binding NarL/FixJ family response regulator